MTLLQLPLCPASRRPSFVPSATRRLLTGAAMDSQATTAMRRDETRRDETRRDETRRDETRRVCAAWMAQARDGGAGDKGRQGADLTAGGGADGERTSRLDSMRCDAHADTPLHTAGCSEDEGVRCTALPALLHGIQPLRCCRMTMMDELRKDEENRIAH